MPALGDLFTYPQHQDILHSVLNALSWKCLLAASQVNKYTNSLVCTSSRLQLTLRRKYYGHKAPFYPSQEPARDLERLIEAQRAWTTLDVKRIDRLPGKRKWIVTDNLLVSYDKTSSDKTAVADAWTVRCLRTGNEETFMPGYRFSDLDARDGVLAVSAVRVKTMPDGEGRVTARGLIKVSFYELERPKNTANMVPTPKTPTPHPYAKDITLNTLWDADSAGSQRAGVILGECNSIMVRPCWHPLGITRSWETGEAMWSGRNQDTIYRSLTPAGLLTFRERFSFDSPVTVCLEPWHGMAACVDLAYGGWPMVTHDPTGQLLLFSFAEESAAGDIAEDTVVCSYRNGRMRAEHMETDYVYVAVSQNLYMSSGKGHLRLNWLHNGDVVHAHPLGCMPPSAPDEQDEPRTAGVHTIPWAELLASFKTRSGNAVDQQLETALQTGWLMRVRAGYEQLFLSLNDCVYILSLV